jgi:hypothetical protein
MPLAIRAGRSSLWMEEEQDRGEERKIEQGTDSAQERGEMEGLREGRGELECWGVSDI